MKFMHGASGPHRFGWQLSTCPAINGHNFSAGSILEDDKEMAVGFKEAMGGEVLRASDPDNVLLFGLLSSVIMLESRPDWSMGDISASMLRSCE